MQVELRFTNMHHNRAIGFTVADGDFWSIHSQILDSINANKRILIYDTEKEGFDIIMPEYYKDKVITFRIIHRES